MSSRRVPLGNNANAANSPFKAVVTTADKKQKRSYATIQREESYGQPPPAKKQMLEARHVLRTPPRQQQQPPPSGEGRVFTRRSNATQQTEFERKCVAASKERQGEKPVTHRVVKEDQMAEANSETMKTWRKHHRKLFPKFVFYFENVPSDVHAKCAKQVVALGSREEKFFSNAVTHVVTTRTIPAANSGSSAISSISNGTRSQSTLSQTINPSLLDRSAESANTSLGARGKFTFEAPISRRIISTGHDGDIRRQQTRSSDLLHRARDLGMKLWALEKLQRMMAELFEEDGYQVTHVNASRGSTISGTGQIPRTAREADLSQLLRNERINGPSDRDPTVSVSKELILFKGHYLYIRDMDEKQKPILVREYARVANKHEGEWPQFRSVTGGKCPFVPEVDVTRRDAEKKQQEKEVAVVPRTRAAAAAGASHMQPPRTLINKRALSDMGNASNRTATVSSKQTNPFDSAKSTYSHRSGTEPSSRGHQNSFVSREGAARLFGGEPVASGLQQSNITSAIRSNFISSTAAQPGAKAGISKEVHALQRKVFEKNSGVPASYIPNSHRLADVSMAAREDTAGRPTKRKLVLIEEDVDPSESEEAGRKNEASRKAEAVLQRKVEKRDAKPGYCENCQDKFEDFDEHVLSRKHRKFAEKSDNWKDLDTLLDSLARPIRKSDD